MPEVETECAYSIIKYWWDKIVSLNIAVSAMFGVTQ